MAIDPNRIVEGACRWSNRLRRYSGHPCTASGHLPLLCGARPFCSWGAASEARHTFAKCRTRVHCPEGMTLAGMTGRPPPTVTTGAPGGAHATANSGGPPLAGITKSPGLVQPALLGSSAEHTGRPAPEAQLSSAKLAGANQSPDMASQARATTLAVNTRPRHLPIGGIVVTRHDPCWALARARGFSPELIVKKCRVGHHNGLISEPALSTMR